MLKKRRRKRKRKKTKVTKIIKKKYRYKIDNKYQKAKIQNLLSKTMGCFSGYLMSSASIQKLFCGIYLVFKCSFDEFVGEKMVSPSYSSASQNKFPRRFTVFLWWDFASPILLDVLYSCRCLHI